MSGSASCPPHDQQKRFQLDTSARQCGQVRASRAPHSSQNLAPAGFVAWHRGHRIEQVAKETDGDAGEPGEYTECRKRNSREGSSGGNRGAFSLISYVTAQVHMDDSCATMEQNILRNSSGNLTILTAIRRASSLLSNFAHCHCASALQSQERAGVPGRRLVPRVTWAMRRGASCGS